jgi:hypothetical protein
MVTHTCAQLIYYVTIDLLCIWDNVCKVSHTLSIIRGAVCMAVCSFY